MYAHVVSFNLLNELREVEAFSFPLLANNVELYNFFAHRRFQFIVQNLETVLDLGISCDKYMRHLRLGCVSSVRDGIS